MKCAVVCMSHCPFYLENWVDYHCKLGFDRIYLRLEGPKVEDYLKRLKNHPVVKILEYQLYPMGNQMERQSFLVMSAIEESKKEGIDFLLHIDDDELFFLSAPDDRLTDFLRRHSKDRDFLHFQNVEAVYKKDRQPRTCFEAVSRFRDCRKEECRGYGNGKSMACLKNSPDVQVFGVHYFTGKGKNIDPNEAKILHYESCDFEEWKWKFSRPNPSNFRFYQESRKQISSCERSGHQDCLSRLELFYSNATTES